MSLLGPGDQVRNLLGSYCDLIDAADYGGVGALFGDSGVLADEQGTPLATGAADIARFYAEIVRLHDGQQRTKHIVANTRLDPGADGTSITARSSYLVLQALEGMPLQPIITGRYLDTFEVDGAGSWRWEERRFSVDLTGDLSQHLR